MTVEELVKEAAAQGIRDLPEPSHLTHIRIWPAHAGRWVAEVGQPPHNVTVGELHESRAVARSAALAHQTESRGRLMVTLPQSLVERLDGWPEPVIDEWDQ